MTTTQLRLATLTSLVCAAVATGWAMNVAASGQTETECTKPVANQPRAAAQQPEKDKKPTAKERIADIETLIQTKNSLLQIIFAIESYHDAHERLPQDIVDKNGKPLLSWRIEILPYIEQGELYNQFKLNEPWDSEHNKKLLNKIPHVYRNRFDQGNGSKTYYQVFSGPETPFGPGRKTKLTDIRDGISNTLGVVECGPPVEWTKPEDLAYDHNKPLPKLDFPFKNLFAVSCLDHSIHYMRPNLDEDVLRRLIEHADGKPALDLDDLVVKFPITKDDVEKAQEILKHHELIIAAIAAQLKEQQKILTELSNKQKAAQVVHGKNVLYRIGWLKEFNSGLEETLAKLTKDTEDLRKQLEAAGKK